MRNEAERDRLASTLFLAGWSADRSLRDDLARSQEQPPCFAGAGQVLKPGGTIVSFTVGLIVGLFIGASAGALAMGVIAGGKK